MKIALRVIGLLLGLVVAVLLGAWLGAITAPTNDLAESATPESAQSSNSSAYAPPLFLGAPMGAGGDRPTLLQEITMASQADVHLYMMTVPLPWPNHGTDARSAIHVIDDVLTTDPAARVLLQLKLDPPDSWLAATPNAVVSIVGQPQPSVCLASPVWREEVRHGLDLLWEAIDQSGHRDRVMGMVLTCLQDGRWTRPNGFDTSSTNVDAFRAWLTARYTNDAALQATWADPSVSLANAAVPERPNTSDVTNVFAALPVQQRVSDYVLYVSDLTADTITDFASFVKKRAGETAQVFAAYGASFETPNGDGGQLALGRLLDSPLNGFVTPISAIDRGLGGVGGFMGPVDSARLHGKWWYLIDDTRTGLVRDATTGSITRMAGVRAEDVHNVQARNFAAALTHQLGLVWLDAAGDGQLLDPEMWKRFRAMHTAYAEAYGPSGYARPDAPSTPYDLRPDLRPVLMVAVDESSRAYQLCDGPLNEFLLTQARDAALCSGTSTQFCLFRDVLDGNAPPASAYLFVNAFRVTADERTRLHQLLEKQGATAIWLYAPGYFADKGASADNIAALTKLPVKAFDAPAKSGSVSQLEGRWITTGTEFAPTREWRPLFYIEGDNVNSVATYRDSGKTSIAITAIETGWKSIYVAEPGLTPLLLRELLQIVEQRLFYRRNALKSDVTYIGPNLLALHASERGERVLDLGGSFAVQDVLTPDRGWPERQYLDLLLNTGETRVFKLTPAAPDEQQPQM